jgi:hypothetical protein
LKSVRTSLLDLLISDIAMAEMDGHKLAQKVL